MAQVAIVPIMQDHVESFHRALEIERLQRRAVRIDGVYENVIGMAVLL